MTIKFMFRGNCYSLDFGRKTPWMGQIFLISLTKEIYKNREVVWAELIWTLGGKIK